MRIYGLRNWTRQGYKQMKDELGWADFMVRSDRAIRRHWTLVCCAFAFCWWHAAQAHVVHSPPVDVSQAPSGAGKKNQHRHGAAMLAAPVALGARLADPSVLAETLLGRLCRYGPASRTRRAARRPERRRGNQPLPADLTNYRYLHFGSDAGGNTAAVVYTLLGTARLNGINPQRYLHHVLERIADHPSNRIDELLPWVVAATWGAHDANAKTMPLAA